MLGKSFLQGSIALFNGSASSKGMLDSKLKTLS